jgi:hypothetical protein
MQKSTSWEANSRSGSQILHCLRNPKVHDRVHKSRLLDHALSEINPIKSNFDVIYCNVILDKYKNGQMNPWYSVTVMNFQ